jgi:DNA (cytosine-5)-methyltransferase 1
MWIDIMRHGSLFSGIGGFDLAATWMGWENVFCCEKDRFCRRVLRHYWPHIKSYEDIKEFDATEYRGRIDILSGGFPCQPFSVAGKRRGAADDRYLWPHMCRVVGEIRPRWVVGENVFGLLNLDGGMVFRKVLSDLEAKSYEVWPYVLPAASVGAPHKRDRIFFVAHAIGVPINGWPTDRSGKGFGYGKDDGRRQKTNISERLCSPKNVADADGIERCEGGMYEARPKDAGCDAGARDTWNARYPWREFPTQPPLCGGDDGLSRELDGIAFSAWGKESVKAYGNAVVPQVAWQIFRVIERMERGYERVV